MSAKCTFKALAKCRCTQLLKTVSTDRHHDSTSPSLSEWFSLGWQISAILAVNHQPQLQLCYQDRWTACVLLFSCRVMNECVSNVWAPVPTLFGYKWQLCALLSGLRGKVSCSIMTITGSTSECSLLALSIVHVL